MNENPCSPDTLILGDSLEIMKLFPDKSVDWILTSPPFKDDEVPGEYYEWFDKVIAEFNRLCKNYSIVFNSSTRLVEICKRYNPERILIWYKGVLKYSYRYEPIFLFNHGSSIKINKRIWSDTFKFQPYYNPVVPYTNPVELYIAILNMITRPGDLILDPFLGSGTTVIACKRIGRHYIGIEINPRYYNEAIKRIKEIDYQVTHLSDYK